jgi:hypothetical protein
MRRYTVCIICRSKKARGTNVVRYASSCWPSWLLDWLQSNVPDFQQTDSMFCNRCYCGINNCMNRIQGPECAPASHVFNYLEELMVVAEREHRNRMPMNECDAATVLVSMSKESSPQETPVAFKRPVVASTCMPTQPAPLWIGYWKDPIPVTYWGSHGSGFGILWSHFSLPE